MILGTGVDVVDVERIRKIILRWGDKFLDRVLTAGEKDYCRGHADPSPSVAARVAAKESLFKALGTGLVRGMSWRDVEVVRDENGRPTLSVSGETLRRLRELGASRIHVSLSHSERVAQAVVILER